MGGYIYNGSTCTYLAREEKELYLTRAYNDFFAHDCWPISANASFGHLQFSAEKQLFPHLLDKCLTSFKNYFFYVYRNEHYLNSISYQQEYLRFAQTKLPSKHKAFGKVSTLAGFHLSLIHLFTDCFQKPVNGCLTILSCHIVAQSRVRAWSTGCYILQCNMILTSTNKHAVLRFGIS